MNSRGTRCRKRLAGGVVALTLGVAGLIAGVAVPAQADACTGVRVTGASGTECVTVPGGTVNVAGRTTFVNLSPDTATVTCGSVHGVLPADPRLVYIRDSEGRCDVSFFPR